MVAVVWQLTIHEDTDREFERFYGADGEWTKLSRKSRSFLGSSFLRDLAVPSRYLAGRGPGARWWCTRSTSPTSDRNQGARGATPGIHCQRRIARSVLGARRADARRTDVVPAVGRMTVTLAKPRAMRSARGRRRVLPADADALRPSRGSGAACGRGGAAQLQSRHPADPLQQLLRLPRAGREAARDEVPLRHQRGHVPRGRRHRAGQRRRRACSSRRSPNRIPKDRMPPPDSGHALTDDADRDAAPLDRRGRAVGHALGLRGRRSAPSRRRRSRPAWVRNPIDQFILARLEREGLKPSPEADKATLLRRVTYDLTGLPPTPAEIDAFLADTSPDAYEKRVDALLASPHYGERMAMPWLDAARYADTHGYHIDSLRGDVAVARLGHQRLQPQPAVRRVRRSSSSPATCCPTRRATRRSPPASTATT